jgi:hypothetical protein
VLEFNPAEISGAEINNHLAWQWSMWANGWRKKSEDHGLSKTSGNIQEIAFNENAQER